MAEIDRKEVQQDYLNGIKYKDLAEKYGVTINTIKSWKQRYGWEKVHTNEKSVQAKKCEKRMVKSVEDNSHLTDQQKEFCLYYVQIYNASQAAIRAGYSLKTSRGIGYNLLQNPAIGEEIKRLKAIKANFLFADGNDVVEKMMHIAFADIKDYVSFGQRKVQVMAMYGPVYEKTEDGEKVPLMKTVNYIDLKESANVDTSIISEVSQGKDGVKIKRADSMKALEWLATYFELNPTDRHKQEYDKRHLELEMLKVQSSMKSTGEESIADDDFLQAMNAQAVVLWKSEDDTDPSWEENNDVG